MSDSLITAIIVLAVALALAGMAAWIIATVRKAASTKDDGDYWHERF